MSYGIKDRRQIVRCQKMKEQSKTVMSLPSTRMCREKLRGGIGNDVRELHGDIKIDGK